MCFFSEGMGVSFQGQLARLAGKNSGKKKTSQFVRVLYGSIGMDPSGENSCNSSNGNRGGFVADSRSMERFDKLTKQTRSCSGLTGISILAKSPDYRSHI